MCEEESDDAEAVAKLFEINDSIHRTVERYKLVKKGDVEGASKIPKGTLGTSTGVGKNASNELSLIDFEPESSANGQVEGSGPPDSAKDTKVEDDLLGLSIDEKPFGQTGGIALGFGANASKSSLNLHEICEIQTNQIFYRYPRPGTPVFHNTTKHSQSVYSYNFSPTSATAKARL